MYITIEKNIQCVERDSPLENLRAGILCFNDFWYPSCL